MRRNLFFLVTRTIYFDVQSLSASEKLSNTLHETQKFESQLFLVYILRAFVL